MKHVCMHGLVSDKGGTNQWIQIVIIFPPIPDQVMPVPDSPFLVIPYLHTYESTYLVNLVQQSSLYMYRFKGSQNYYLPCQAGRNLCFIEMEGGGSV